ncbi:bacteriophage N4 receptor, outer membrane subunit [bacterium BMS3Abin01]|nr:bacteriophage N4 receptor, outer membrane subunit [bacterium BMS3Abin01]HDZ59291.1 tetratricopeptide repeat protein [Actinomycetota bacterium]
MSEQTFVAMDNTGDNMSRLINYLIIFLLVALVAAGGSAAYIYFIKGEPVDPTLERSLETWKQAVIDDPADALARANLGATYLDMGRTKDATRELEAALEIAPDSFAYTYKLGFAYRDNGDYDKAIDMFVRSAELTPEGEKYTALYEAAATARMKGDMEAAKGYAGQSIDDNDMIWNSHLLLGQLYEEEGDLEGARKEYQAAARFNPGNEELQQAIARVSGQGNG